MLELAILGLLKERSMHGYQLSKRLTDTLGGFWRVSYGSLYPSLRRLEKDGAVEQVFDEQEVGRRKNVYRITDKGEHVFIQLLEEAGNDNSTEDTRFRVRLAFFKYLAPDTRIRLLERRQGVPRGAPVHDPDLPRRDRRWLRHVHAFPHAARPRHDRAGHRLAERPHRGRAASALTYQRGNEAQGDTCASQKGARLMSKVRLAIVGVGNCASSLVQGLEYYKDADPEDRVPGLMHVELGGYHIRDIEVVAAFDVDAKKVGTDVAEAIFSEPNNTIRFAEVPPTGITVQRGRTLDGLGKYYRETVQESDQPEVDVTQVLRDTEADVLVCYLPVGSEQAAKFYAQCAIDADVAFVNCLPVFIASDPAWARRFVEAGVPIIGDDVKSQVGATIVHRVLTKLFEDRGVKLNRTYQLNFGGNMDFMNMLERERLVSKKQSKTQSVQSQLRKPLDKKDIHIGPSDYVPWLEDRKWAQIRLEGQAFGDVPLIVELKLEVWDSPNSAGIVIDALRAAKLAKDRGVAGPLIGPSAYFMKSPPVQFSDEAAREMVEEFILGNGASKAADWTAFFDVLPADA